MEDEVFELVKVYSTVSIVIYFLKQLCCKSFLDWNLKLYEHLLKFIKAQKIHFVYIKFFKELFQDKLLVNTFGPLNQLESDEFYSAFYFLWLNFFGCNVRNSPLTAYEFNKSLIVRNVETQIVIKIEEFFLSDESFRSKRD